MSLRLSYFVPPAIHVEARERGLLSSTDIIEMSTTGSEEQFEGLRDGTIDVAVTAIDNLYEWVPRGADVLLAGQVETTTPLSLMSLSEISALDDLSGRVVGVDAFNNGFALLARTILRERGIEVKFVEVGGVRERYQSLLAGTVDATLLGPPLTSLAIDAGMVELARVADYFPAFPGQGLVVRRAVAQTTEFTNYRAALSAAGLMGVDRAGLDLLHEIRVGLNVLPGDMDLFDVLMPPGSQPDNSF